MKTTKFNIISKASNSKNEHMNAINTFINVSETACHSSHNSNNWGVHSHTHNLKNILHEDKDISRIYVESATCAIK